MKFLRYPALAEAMGATRSFRVVDVTALINRTLAANLPSGALPSLDGGHATFPLRSLQGLLSKFSVQDAGAPADGDLAGAREGRFLEKSYRSGAKAHSYLLYLPSSAKPGMPLVVMLHGCTQSAEDFARGTGMNILAEKLGFIVAYPSQTQAANQQKCWNWFKPSDQQRDRGEPAMIAGLTRQIIAEHECDSTRVYIAGLSAGGAAAAVMADAYPDVYAAVGIHSGLPCGSARDIPSAFMAMKQGGGRPISLRSNASFVPVITFHGDQDTTVSEINSQHIVAAATAAAGDLTIHSESGQVADGRRYTCERRIAANGETVIEQWTIRGGGHAWSGGSSSGTYTDPQGPDASAEMMRFFLAHRRTMQ